MKKLYIIFSGLLLTGGLYAQSAQAPAQHLQPATAPVLHGGNASTLRNAPSSTQSLYHAYLEPAEAAIDIIDLQNASGTFTLYVDPVFQDSSVQAVFSNGASYVTSQKLGGTLDPKSTTLFPGYNLNSTTSYTIDTVWIAGAYTILPAHPLAGDTIQVELTWGTTSATYFQGLVINGPPQENFTMPKNNTSLAMGNQSFSTATSANKATLYYILTAADTISTANNPWNQFFHFIPVVPTTPITIPANNIVAVQYTFAPQAAYSANDIYFDGVGNTATMNSFLPYIWEQTGLNSTNGADYFYDGTSRSISGVLNSESRYGQWPVAQNFLNGCMLPFTNDGLVWGMSISASTGAGVAENNGNNFSLDQNMPNPTNGTTTINYSLNVPAHVLFNIVDVTGKEIMSSDRGNLSAGQYNVEVNTSNLSAGLYFYTLTVDGQKVTRRMVVTE